MAPSIKSDSQARIIGEKLVKNVHQRLAEANILYLMTSAKRTDKGQNVYATIQKAGGLVRYLSSPDNPDTRADYIILITEEWWYQLNEKQREIVLDHELCHAIPGEPDKQGKKTWDLRGHDLEEFNAIVQRHGNWRPALTLMHQAMNQLPLQFTAREAEEEDEEEEVDEDALLEQVA